MTPEQFTLIEVVFELARRLPVDDRPALLDKRCRDDSTVRRKVEQLLARYDEATRTEGVWRTPANPDHDTRSIEFAAKASELNADKPGDAPGDLARSEQPSPEIPGYEIVRELHRGGQGVVYLAIQKSSKGKVAIKVLLERRNSSRRAKHAAQKRFEREIELVAQLRHPNIITLFDSGTTADGRAYFVMDYVRGVTLSEFVRNGKLPLEHMLDVFRLACLAVHYAHERCVVHRDLKPSNILVDADGVVKVLDFGLAKLISGPPETQVSVAGEPMGTFLYMSPEQTRGDSEELDIRTDVYSLGVILYELLTGKHPYPIHGALSELMEHIAESPPMPLSDAWDREAGIRSVAFGRDPGSCPLDAELEIIVSKALAKEPERRYANAGALAMDIQRYLQGEALHAKRDSLVYRLRTRTRRIVGRNQVAALMVGTLAAGLFFSEVGGPFVHSRVNIEGALQNWFERAFSPGYPAPALRAVRVIALDDSTDVEALARSEGLEGVSADYVRSFRRLHGRLMERLAKSHCRSVSFDIEFSESSDFDADFVAGVQALEFAGVDVIVRVENWALNAEGLPAVCPEFSQHVRWGSTMGGCTDQSPWKLQLVARTKHPKLKSSLALQALGAHLHAGTIMRLDLDAPADALDLSFWEKKDYGSGAEKGASGPFRVELTHFSDKDAEPNAFVPGAGLDPDDVVGLYQLIIPSDDVLAASTVPYAAVFSANTTQLVDWFGGRSVVVGNIRHGLDLHKYADGRFIQGTHALATAIDSLIGGAGIRHAGFPVRPIANVIAAFCGCAAAIAFRRGPARPIIAMASLALLATLATAFAYRYHHCFFNTVELTVSALAAFALAAAVNRAYYHRRA